MAKTAIKPDYENWPKQKVKITDLFLDSKNIRLDIGVDLSQDALINDLFSNEDAMQVLKSIAVNGFFPDEIPVAIKEKGKFIVLEGNRRVAAVKALLRPEIVPSKESAIKEILKTAVPISNEREVVVAPDRDSAMVFLANKHTLNTKRRWRPLRQAYFYRAELDRGKTVQNLRDDYPTVDIGKFLRLLNVHKIAKSIKYDSDATAKKVHNEKTFPASTIERLYDDKQVRDFLGFDFDGNGEVKIAIDKKEFEKGFKKVVEDVVEKNVDSRALNAEKDRKIYLDSFAKENTPNKTKGTKTLTSKDFEEIPVTTEKRRVKLAPKNINFLLQCNGVKRMLKELQTIDYHKFPNASHDLLRSFLECGLKAYFDHCGTTVAPKNGGKYVYLDTVLEEFIKEMNQAKNNKLSQVASRIKDNAKMNSYSATFLNATNHNPDIFVTPQEVEDAWEAMEPLFRFILAPKQQSNGQTNP
ncbi:MAG: hypothetical protein WC410_00170 [Candidatus Paceibacterota bacterium]|jgi:hypothetical protein